MLSASAAECPSPAVGRRPRSARPAPSRGVPMHQSIPHLPSQKQSASARQKSVFPAFTPHRVEYTCNSQKTAASVTPVTCNVSDPDPAHSSPTTPPALPPPRSSDRVHLVVCYSTQCRSHTVWDQMPIATTLPGSPTLSNQVSHATPTARRATHMPSPFDTPSAASWPSPPCSHMGLPATLATGAAGTCVAGR